MVKLLGIVCLSLFCGSSAVLGQGTQPMVAIHDSELTRALESMSATADTPTGVGTTNKQWWPTDWHYFVMPESVKEALRSDGTAFTVVGDSNITAGVLLTNGLPKYPIVISLASEAIRNDEIAQLTNYVAAGGFLLVGSSAFTRNTNGTTRGDFAFANQMGVHMVVPGLTNWTDNNTFTTITNHRLVGDIPSGQLTWRMPWSSEEIPWGISPSHPFLAPHDLWEVSAAGSATVVAAGDNHPFLVVKPYGKGYFIYHAAFQPLVGHGGFAPGMYAYMILRRAIEWAFESANLPVPKISPWPYPYDAAFMIRHDLENYATEVVRIEASAQAEFINGAKGDYYFCTGTVREDVSSSTRTSITNGLRRAVTNYNATIGPHNGGLKNPVDLSLTHSDYDYWHWGPDEALDVTPAGYASGKAYASTSISNSFKDIEGWLSGTGNGSGLRTWVACYFNGTREDSYDLQAQLGVKIAGDQKLSPFPHWTLSTRTAGKRYSVLSEPVSDWYVDGGIAQSMEPWHPPGVHTTQTVHDAVDFYYGLGALINIYSHCLTTGLQSDAAPSSGNAYLLVPEYMTYSLNTNLHPRIWSANAVGVYQWWLQRSNAQISVGYSTNGYQSVTTILISGATHTNTAVEVLVPGPNSFCSLQVLTNGVLAGTNVYRAVTNALNGHQTIRVRVGTSVTNAVVRYYPLILNTPIFSQSFDSVTAPGLPSGWTTSASGAQSAWVTQTATNDTPPNAAFSIDATNVGVNQLVSPEIVLPAGQAQLVFRNNYDLELEAGASGFDGGVLEIKIGTNVFVDILSAGGSFDSGGYTNTISSSYGNPLAGRQAWSGNSGGFITTVANLPASASGQTIQLQWRCGTDNGGGRSGWRIDTVVVNSIACLCCPSTNNPPVLPSQTNRTIAETITLTVTNAATDVDVPAQTLTYTLVNAPAGAGIGANGVITWSPVESQGPGTFALTTVVTDSGLPALSATNSFTVVVNEVNSPPALPALANLTILEQTTLTVTNSATDPDLPANPLGYTLLVAPTNAVINTNTGVITWTPTEAQGPSTNTFTTRVVDNGGPPLSATNTFTVVVNESNSPPVLPVQTNRTIAALTTLVVNTAATDSDLPANTLSYSLLTAPTNAVINTNTGVITWTPTQAQNNSTNLVRTVVTDFNPSAVNAQHLSATNSFTVVVSSKAVVVLDSTVLVAEGCLPTNNVIDPGETVTMLFAFKNTGTGNTTNLVVTLLQTNGIAGPSGPQSYGVLVAGGAAASQSFMLTATGACGGAITATLQMQDGAANLGTAVASFSLGQTLTILTQNFDTVTAPALPSGWTTSGTGAFSGWTTSASVNDTAPNAAFSADANTVGVNDLLSPAFTLPNGPAQLTFRNNYALEILDAITGYDGGVLEIKIGTNAFVDITNAGGIFLSGGYNTTISTLYSNALVGRRAWSGNSGGFTNTMVSLPAGAAGQTIQLRWRCGTDNGGVSGAGWRVDTIGINGSACCGNTAPVLPLQTNRTINELSALTVTNTATDPGSLSGALNYSLLVAPANAVISTNGVITWTPTEAQGPSPNTFTTTVSDNGAPPLSATNTFAVTVNEVNSAPVLTVPADQTIDELALWSANATALDTDLPPNTLTFELVSGPSGLTVSSGGLISWTPSEAQGPSTNPVTVRVFDSGVPSLSATNSFTLTVNEMNSAPVLSVPANQTISELALWGADATAVDTDLPPNTLTFELVAGPSGLTVSSGGLISWTPSEAQGPSTNSVTVRVFDNGVSSLSATNSFVLSVNEANSAPVLTVPANQTIDELVLWSANATVVDSDLPPNTLTFELVSGPGGLTVSSGGLISWTPSEAQGPSTNSVTVRVFDGGVPSLSATNSFVLTVNEANSAPVLTVPANQTISELALWSANATVVDSDLPPNTLTFELVSGPSGLTVSSGGLISWTPSEAQGPSTNSVTVRVFDNGVSSLSATNSFVLTINEVNSAPGLTVPANQTISELALWSANAMAVDTDLPPNTLTFELVSGPSGLTVSSGGLVSWTPSEAEGPSTNPVTVRVFDNGVPSLSATNSFVLTVNEANSAPVLTVPANQTISELALWSANATVVDSDLPPNTLTFELVTGPGGLTVSSGGMISWTPSEAQGPSTNAVTVRVFDNGVPSLSATNSFVLTVNEANSAPVLTVPANQTISELALWSANVTAGDTDLPPNTLTFELVSGPSGLTVSSGGFISWTPSEAQGPGTNPVTVRVFDSGVPSLSATNSFALTVNEMNSAPVLTVPANQTINELVLWSANATVVDSDLPPNTLTFELVTGPSGLTVSSGGLVSWTPSEAQGPSTNPVTVRVFDNGVPSLSATNNFVLTVNEGNSAPVLTVPTTQTIDELVLWSANATAVDTDLPPNTLTFELVSGPSGLTVSSGGLISWTPSETQGPSTNPVTVRVFDDGLPGLSATNNFVLTVNEANSAPVLTVPADQTIDELALWSANASAVDTDLPPNTLTFELVSGPSGLTVSSGGLISWTPSEAQGPSTNPVTVRVFDDGVPSLSATNTFVLTVNEENSAPVLTVPADQTIDELALWSANATAVDTDLPPNTLTFELVSGPSGLTVSSGGLISWTPSEAQGPSTNPVIVRVFDSGVPSLSATNSFTLTVNERNNAPVLTVPTDQTIDELALWSANATAVDTDLPPNTLTFELVTGPSGLTVSSGGLISWTPSEAQGPSTNPVTVRVFDDGVPSLSATNSFVLTVNEANSAPVLTVPANQTISELALWSANATVVDTDLSPNTLTFELVSGPSGLTVNSGGLISWTPSEAQGPSTNPVIVRVFDDGLPGLSATNSFVLTVNEANSAPVLTVPTDQTIDELALWSANATAVDPDLPPSTLTFELVSGPSGLMVSSGGLISWTPSEAQGPSTNPVTVRVFDDGVPSLSATNSFVLTVNEANSAPVLTVPTDQTIDELALWSANATAVDTDLPPNTLTFELVSGPDGLTVSSNGVISWTPSEAQGPGTNVVSVRVFDDGVPALSTTNTFALTVNEVNSVPVLPMQSDRTIGDLTLLTVTNTAMDGDIPINLLTYTLLAGPTNAVISTNGVITWTPDEAQAGSTNPFTTEVVEDGLPPLSATNTFTVTVTKSVPPPLILSIGLTNGMVAILWNAIDGRSYKLQYKDQVDDTNWTDLPPNLTGSGGKAVAVTSVGDGAERFYRVVLLP